MPNCYYYDEQHNHCKCYVNENLNELLAENAKLREDLEFERSENGWVREFLNRMGQKCGTEDCPSLVAYVTKMEAENAKLRELVQDLWFAAQYLGMNPDGATGRGFARQMRELGVEVVDA